MKYEDAPKLGTGAALSEDPEVRAIYWRQQAERLAAECKDLAESRRALFRKCNELQAEIAELRNPN